MQAFTRSVFDLFSAKKRYLVPMFQRPYVWSQEKQWEPLWDDIRGKAIEQLERREVDPHFLGAIVINQVRTYGPAIPAHEIIDGQQRLTTFQLFLAAFRDLAGEFGDADTAAELSGYTLNAGKKGTPEEEFKVWPTRADQRPFAQAIQSGGRSALEALHPPIRVRCKLQPRQAIIEAYLYFEESIRAFVMEEGQEATEDRIQALFSALQNSLQLVSIELESKDDPQIIFETLNARGEPLLSSDLLRNFVFLRAKREGVSADTLYNTYWEPFDVEPAEDGDPAKRFWKVEERQGRLVRPRLDLFIQHFLSLKTGRDVNVGRLFHHYRDWIETEKPYPSVEEELKELRRYAAVFAKFFVPDLATQLGKFIHRLQRLLDTSTIFPFLLYLEADCRMDAASKNRVLSDLESFLVRRIVCGLTEKAYNRLFLQFIRSLREAECPSPESFRSLLLGLSGDSQQWPDDQRFQDAWLRQPIYRTAKSTARIETMLRAIEEYQPSDRREQIRIMGPLTIEHVMPQEWEEHWPLPPQQDPAAAAEERETLIHTFGNLTLLTLKLNAAVSNAPFATKRPAITQESALRLNTFFQDVNVWDEAGIRRRGVHLLQTARTIWPFPADPQMIPAPPLTDSVNRTPLAPPSERPQAQVEPHKVNSPYLEFWQGLVGHLAEAGSTLQPAKPYPQNWLYFKLAPGGFCLEATAVSNPSPRLSCGLTIKRPDALLVLEWLNGQRKAFGGDLDWTSRNDRSVIECHVQTHWEGAAIQNQSNWPQQFRWLHANLEKLQAFFGPILAPQGGDSLAHPSPDGQG